MRGALYELCLFCLPPQTSISTRDIHSEEVNSESCETHTPPTPVTAEEISEAQTDQRQNICMPASPSCQSPEDAMVTFIADAFG